MVDPSPAERMKAAADLLSRLGQAATKAPWLAITTPDICAVVIPAGECTCRAKGRDDAGHQPGCGHDLVCYPDRGPDDARLIAATRSLAGPVAAWLRDAAEALDARMALLYGPEGEVPEVVSQAIADAYARHLAVTDAVLRPEATDA